MPLGPRVVLTRSEIAIAPTNDCYRVSEMSGRISYKSSIFTSVFLSVVVKNSGGDVLKGDKVNKRAPLDS